MIKKLIVLFSLSFIAINAYAVDGLVSKVEQQKKEIEQKQQMIKKETDRLQALKGEVEADITKFTELLKQIDKSLKQAEEQGNKRLAHVAKAYEAMQPEDAASRLSGLDDKTAVQILLKMSSKKAGLVIGMMQPAKATTLTKHIAKLKK